MTDPRPLLFASVAGRTVTAAVFAEEAGIITRTEAAGSAAVELGLTVEHVLPDGKPVTAGEEIIRVSGDPLAIAHFEERAIGIVAKPSGIATAARHFVDRAGGRPRIVSGAWKKLPFAHKEMIRAAIVAGGAEPRIAEWPFAYLDKNFVLMLGGVHAALRALAEHPELARHRRIVQVVDQYEARAAAESGADIVFVDTGRTPDLVAASEALHAAGLRKRVELAFGGGVRLDDIDRLRDVDVDIVDVGRPIVDAPLLDLSLRVVDAR